MLCNPIFILFFLLNLLNGYINVAQANDGDILSQIFSAPRRPSMSSQQKFVELAERSKNRDFVSTDDAFNSIRECENDDSGSLMKRLKDEGDYNPSYMAPTIDEAAQLFQDLSVRPYQVVDTAGTCDRGCLETRDKFIEALKALDKLPPEDKIILKPDLSNTRPRMSNGAMARLYHNSNKQLLDQSFGSLNSQFRPFMTRSKRYAEYPDSIPQSSLEPDIGQASAVYCWKAGDQGRDKSANLFHLCTACRSIKVLSPMHFPRYLNQVECGGGECLNGEGVCTKQYIIVKVLKNNGTEKCPRWVKEQIRLSVCCDCMLKKESYSYGNVIRNNFMSTQRG